MEATARKLREDGKSVDEVAATIKKKFKMSVADQLKLSNNFTDQIKHRILKKDPKIYQKKLIVFPEHEDNHWKVTFVFNLYADHPEGKGKRFFFRYDPYNPEGLGCFQNKQGFIWFMNLLASTLDADEKMGDEESMKLKYNPEFGLRFRDGLVLGTEKFPALWLNKDQLKHIPRQQDGHNCGLAVIATTAIIISSLHKSVSLTSSVFDWENLQVFPPKNETDDKPLGPEGQSEFHCEFIKGSPFDIHMTSDVNTKKYLAEFCGDCLVF